MSVKDQQVQRVIEEILKGELQAGRFPDAAVINRKLQTALRERFLGAPRYEFQGVKENEISNPVAYNQTLSHIHEDLDVAFKEVGTQNDNLSNMANMYETEKRLLSIQLKKLQSRILKLNEKMNARYHHQVVHEGFHTFNDVDLDQTNAFVDLERNQVTLQTVQTGALQHNLSMAGYNVKMIQSEPKAQGVEEASFNNALRDTVNETWKYVVTQDAISPVSVEVILSLPETIEANRLGINFHSPKETTVTLYLSEDGIVWKEYKTYTSYDKAEWLFSQNISKVKFVFTKSEPDVVSGTNMTYYFGVKQVSLKKDSYLYESQFMSQAFPVNVQLDKIRLETQEVIYPQTSIRYYVGMEGDDHFTEWQEISPNETVRLNQLAHETMSIQRTQIGYGAFVKENFGLSYYSIAELKTVPISKRSQLYMGDYMWKVETKAMPALAPDYIPTLQDWVSVKGVTTSFLPIEETVDQKEWALSAGSIQRFTTYVYCEKEEEVYNAEFKIGSASLQVYLNNNLIKPVVIDESQNRYKYNYRFQAGWNRIEILTYAEKTEPFKPNLYLRDISTKVFAIKDSLQEVSPYDLYNNTSKKDIGYFAIDNGQVVVNYNPVALDETGVGIRYSLEYDYLPAGAKETYTVTLMAILSRQNESEAITPVLKEYKLILE